MKKHSLFKMIAIIIAIAVVLTWIFPITYYGYSYTEEAVSPVGLFDLFSMWPTLFNYFGTSVFYILVIGGFYGILHKTDGYRNLLDKIVLKFKGKERIFLIFIMLIFAVITSMAGITTGLLFIFPFIISLILLMGYNKQIAALTTIGAVAVGLIGTTVSAVNTEAMMGMLGLKFSDELLTKGIILLIGLVLLIFNVLSYAKKHKNSSEESTDESFELPVSNNDKKRVWPIILVVDLILVIMIIGTISWKSVLGISFFEDIHSKITAFTIGDYAIFAKLLGEGSKALGLWTLTEFMLLIVSGAGLIGLIYRIKFNEFIKCFYKGMKKAFKPALLVAIAYLVLVITAMHPVLLGIFKPMLSATNGFNPFTMSIVAFVNSVFGIEPYYIASASGSLQYAVSIITDTNVYSIIAIVWQTMQGLAVLIAPTSVILVATLSYLDISFWQWIKATWKLILEILVAVLIIFTILILI